jgi:hypothetical protein
MPRAGFHTIPALVLVAACAISRCRRALAAFMSIDARRFMPLPTRSWPWLFAVVLLAGGCATFDVGDEPQLDPADHPAEHKSANEPASLAGEAALEHDGGESSVTVHASDTPVVVAPPPQPPLEYRSASNSPAFSRTSVADAATTKSAQAQAQALTAEHVAAFDQLMAEARRRGTLSAAEETAFRRDLAAMPAELRPQMAAMLLAMRNRENDPAALSGVSHAAALRPLDATGDATSLGASDAPTLTTAQRLAKIASPASPAEAGDPLADNPLRALAAAAQIDTRHPAGSPAQGVDQPIQPISPVRPSAPNAPAEIARPAANAAAAPASPLTAWPDAHGTAADDGIAVDREIRNALHREAAAARLAQRQQPSEEWQVMLGATIRSLEAKLADAPEGDDKLRREALLRLLYLVADRLDDAARPVPAGKTEQQFWIDWLYGTSVYLDRQATPSDPQRAAVAADRLREAVHRLGEQANLVISNLAFCRRVTSFGVYEPFGPTGEKAAANQTPQFEFTPNQEVLLYAEVRNFASAYTENGYHTLLRPSYQVFDAQGRRLGSVVELDESHDYCQRPRTDFFVCYHIYLPTRIDPGPYKLKLTIEDIHGRKVHENSVDFSIKTP